MSKWQTTEPPVDTHIEFQRDDRTLGSGALVPYGTFGITAVGEKLGSRQTPQYVIKDKPDEVFCVLRWRVVEGPILVGRG
jgi:hypothetical protein